MNTGTWDGGNKLIVRGLLVGLIVIVAVGASAQEASAPADENTIEAPADVQGQPVEQPADTQAEAAAGESASAPAEKKGGLDPVTDHFAQYLHYALIGQFDIADKHAQALIALPEMNPLSPEGSDKLVKLTGQDRHKDAIDILLLLINNTSIADNAQKVLDLVREAHRRQRMNPAGINDSIRLLAGTPTQQMVGKERLAESGEYAVPWLLETLADPKQKDLHPFIVRVLPQLGKRILNPMVEALAIGNPELQRIVAEALGKIGYPQALPYLKRLATDPKANDVVRRVASAAIAQIVVANPTAVELPAAELFARLAEQYYADQDSLRPDPREPRANVWFARNGTVEPIEVPRDIFMVVMCMRACEASLHLAKDQPPAVALWLAANFRREARLGLDVQEDKVAEMDDLTRPRDFLRSVYFARMAGPAHCLLTLQRAIQDLDRDVALGAIAALRATAGPAALVDPTGKTGLSLAAALRFPDLLVRVRAALALGRAMPAEPFAGHDEVVPILAAALSLTGQKQYLLVDPDATGRANLAEGLTRTGAFVIAVDRFNTGLTRAHKELTHLDGIFLASDIAGPSIGEALPALAKDNLFGLTPVVAYIKQGGNLVADQIAATDNRVGRVLVTGPDQAPGTDFAPTLLDRWAKTAGKYGYGEIGPELSVLLALDAAAALRDIAISGKTVFDVGVARKSLITALGHPAEPLRIACAFVLARQNSAQAQQAIAVVALSDKQSPTLRKAAYAALAESARQFGARLDASMVRRLAELAVGDPDLDLRTAASQALGALNLQSEQAADIILGQN
ncbi:MAG TPA: HEAT repeat domain-containing protein [Phycisphaerae bacterium]|nr:HEAT repeat domain-containing protein [Phycisphaerae bacterium]